MGRRLIKGDRTIDHASLHLADVPAAVAMEIYGQADRNYLAPLRGAMERHIHPNHLLLDDKDPFETDDVTARIVE